jgi:sulfide dehydrogenase cytochrome subunit
MNRRFLSVLSALTLAAPGLAAADVGTLMEKCNGCHGDNGVSQSSDIPTIAGLAPIVHEDALYIYADEARPCAESKFRHGDTSRPATTMCAIAAELSEDDIAALAEAYGELPFVPAKQDFDAGLAAAGEAIHNAECDKCHSEAGMNADDEAGYLGGQQMGYLRDTLAQYRAGTREQPSKMQEKTDALSDADVEALVNFYGSKQ